VAVDTTGAGDVHAGAFLARLLRGTPAVDAARAANAMAARWVATGSYGG
jgi:sugar/nucleoside kinase (ribokinase family)